MGSQKYGNRYEGQPGVQHGDTERRAVGSNRHRGALLSGSTLLRAVHDLTCLQLGNINLATIRHDEGQIRHVLRAASRDSPVPDDVLRNLTETPGFTEARAVTL